MEEIAVKFETRRLRQPILPKGIEYIVYDAITSTNGWIEQIISPNGSNTDVNIHGQRLEMNGMRIQNDSDAGGQFITVRMKMNVGYTCFDLCIRYKEDWKAVYSILKSSS